MSGFRLRYCYPKLRDLAGPPMGLGKISSRDAWRLARSKARFEARPDAYSPSTELVQNEVGIVEGFRLITEGEQHG